MLIIPFNTFHVSEDEKYSAIFFKVHQKNTEKTQKIQTLTSFLFLIFYAI